MTRRSVVAVVVPESGSRRAWGTLLPDALRPRVVVHDDAADPHLSGRVAAALAADPDVYAVVGHLGSPAARLALPTYREAGVPAAFPLATATDVVAAHGDRVHGVLAPMPSDDRQVAAVRNLVGPTAPAVLLGTAAASPLGLAWTAAGGPVVSPDEMLAGAGPAVVLGRLDEVVAELPLVDTLLAGGRDVVLSDDSWIGLDPIGRPGPGRLLVAAVRPSPATLVATAVEHALRMRDLGADAATFVDAWPHAPTVWQVEPVGAARAGLAADGAARPGEELLSWS